MRLTAAITREGDWYVARCLEVEVASQGETFEEARSNLVEALELLFEDDAGTEVDEVLEGARHYDDLNAYEQAITRAEWSERTAATLASLDLAAKFARQGRPYVELDHAGKVARREPRIAD